MAEGQVEAQERGEGSELGNSGKKMDKKIGENEMKRE